MVIRRARRSDVGALVEVYLDTARHHVALDPIAHEEPSHAKAVERTTTKLADRAIKLFVAEVAGEVVGFVEIVLVPSPPEGAIFRSVSTRRVGIAVRQPWRGAGIGTLLMDYAESWASEHGASMIILDMSSGNQDALRLYERLGYETYGLMLRKSLEDRR